mgnify:CR=1 FL=1
MGHVETNAGSMNYEIVVVCYSGQSAAFCASLLKLAGYTNAKSLKFGANSMIFGDLPSSNWNAATMIKDYAYE